MTHCPRLDPRLGPRALTVALLHRIATRGCAACALARIAVALVVSLSETRRDLQSVTSSLVEAVELIRGRELSVIQHPPYERTQLH